MTTPLSPTDIVDWSPPQMLEVYLNDPDDFLKIKETLSRIGVSSKREENVLFQSCHILHKQGRYFIVHFKELFMLDGKPSTFMYDDMCRRNTITILLSDWGLLEIVNRDQVKDITSLKQIKIISHRDKANWDLRSKYSIGNVKKKV
jgi:hypothetical protein